jgi:hypothetical protein
MRISRFGTKTAMSQSGKLPVCCEVYPKANAAHRGGSTKVLVRYGSYSSSGTLVIMLILCGEMACF